MKKILFIVLLASLFAAAETFAQNGVTAIMREELDAAGNGTAYLYVWCDGQLHEKAVMVTNIGSMNVALKMSDYYTYKGSPKGEKTYFYLVTLSKNRLPEGYDYRVESTLPPTDKIQNPAGGWIIPTWAVTKATLASGGCDGTYPAATVSK